MNVYADSSLFTIIVCYITQNLTSNKSINKSKPYSCIKQ